MKCIIMKRTLCLIFLMSLLSPLYIAYHAEDVEPGAHPANYNVQLRMIPAAGGEPEVLTDLFGGQGSLNVNSWSPDSRRFAFMSYQLKDR